MEKTHGKSQKDTESLKINEVIINEEILDALRAIQEKDGLYFYYILSEIRDLLIRESVMMDANEEKVMDLLRGILRIKDSISALEKGGRMEDPLTFLDRFDISADEGEEEDQDETIAAMELKEAAEDGTADADGSGSQQAENEQS